MRNASRLPTEMELQINDVLKIDRISSGLFDLNRKHFQTLTMDPESYSTGRKSCYKIIVTKCDTCTVLCCDV